MELLLLLLGVGAAVLFVRYAFKKYEASKSNVEFDVHPVDFAKEEVKAVLDVNNDGKVDLGDVKVIAEKTKKKAIKATKAVVKKTPGRKKKSVE
jgi:transcription elongation factor